MLNHLTSYLLQYKKVTVPNVGTLRLVQEPPRLNVADKQLEPPSFVVKMDSEENPSEHQLNFLHLAHKDNDAIATKLQFFGNSVRQKMNEGGFDWEGLGRFTNDSKTISVPIGALAPLPAQKVIRHDAPHNVLVGDKEISSAHVFERNTDFRTTRSKRKVFVRAGWILLLLSLLLILLVLYAGKFRTNAAGSRLSPANWAMPYR